MDKVDQILAKKYTKYFKYSSKPERFIPWLNQQAQQGYMLYSIGMLGYRFYKDEPQDLAFSVDFFDIKPEPLKDYIIAAKSLGLKHIYSGSGMHVFAAKKEIAPYAETSRGQQEFYSRCNEFYNKMRAKQMAYIIISGLFTLIGLIFMLIGWINLNKGYTALLYSFGGITAVSLISIMNAYSTLKTAVAYHRVHLKRIGKGSTNE